MLDLLIVMMLALVGLMIIGTIHIRRLDQASLKRLEKLLEKSNDGPALK